MRAVKPRRARVRAANAAGVAAAAAVEAAAAAMATANVALLCTLQANYVRDQGGGTGAQEKAAEGGERSRNSHRRGNCTGVGRWKQKWRWKHERRRVRELRDVAAGRAGLRRWLAGAAVAPARWSGAARLARCAVLAFVVLPIGPKKLTCPCHKSTAKTKVVPGVKEKSKAHCIEAEYGNLGSPGA